jgi:opacity protein-like surface antigen
MKLFLFLLPVWLIFAAQKCFAQNNKKRAFVVLNNRDSLYGWIDQITSKRTPGKISFYKDSLSKHRVTYTIADLSYFEIPCYNAYIRAAVPSTVPMFTTSPLNSSADDTTITQTVWLRIIVGGSKLSLFEWKDDKTHYFLKEGDNEYRELQLKTTPDQGYEKELPLYKNQLTALAIKYELAKDAFSREIDNAHYHEDDLKKIVIQLNGNKNIIHYKTIREKSTWSYLINAGATWAMLKLSGDKTYVGNLEFDPSISPWFSLGVKLSNFGINRLGLRLEVSYSAAKFNGKGSSSTSSNNRVTYELESRTITPSFSAVYNFLQKKHVLMYGCIGLAYNNADYKKNVWRQTFPELTLTDFANLKKNYIACTVKLGIRIMQKFEIGAGRQFFDDFIFQSSKYTFDHPAYNFWVGYRLN